MLPRPFFPIAATARLPLQCSSWSGRVLALCREKPTTPPMQACLFRAFALNFSPPGKTSATLVLSSSCVRLINTGCGLPPCIGASTPRLHGGSAVCIRCESLAHAPVGRFRSCSGAPCGMPALTRVDVYSKKTRVSNTASPVSRTKQMSLQRLRARLQCAFFSHRPD